MVRRPVSASIPIGIVDSRVAGRVRVLSLPHLAERSPYEKMARLTATMAERKTGAGSPNGTRPREGM